MDKVLKLEQGTCVQITQNALNFLELFVMSTQMGPPQKLPVCIQMPWVKDRHILYNTEQLTRKDCLDLMIQSIQLEQVVEQWDYSKANLQILIEKLDSQYHSKLTQRPLQQSKELQNFVQETQANTSKEYDLAFCGTLTPYRKKQLDTLSEKGLKIHIILAFGHKEIIQESCKAKCILNLHAAQDYQIFETLRCHHFLEAGIPVQSEPSLDNDPRCLPLNLIECHISV